MVDLRPLPRDPGARRGGRLAGEVLTGGVAVMLSGARGELAQSSVVAMPGAETQVVFVASADLNADGNADLVATSGDSLFVLLGDGKGRFAPPETYAGGADYVVAGDFDGDGRVDVAALAGRSVSVLLGDGKGRLARPSSSPVGGEGAAQVFAGDADECGDGVGADGEARVGHDAAPGFLLQW